MSIKIIRTIDGEDNDYYIVLTKMNVNQEELLNLILEETKNIQKKAIEDNNKKHKTELNDIKSIMDKKLFAMEQKINELNNANNNYKKEILDLKNELKTVMDNSKKEIDNINKQILIIKQNNNQMQEMQKVMNDKNTQIQKQITEIENTMDQNNKVCQNKYQ